MRRGAYDGEGKTVLRLLNQDAEMGLMINSYSQVGFSLNNGVSVMGPVAIFPRTVLSWNVGNSEDINEASLSLFYTLDPKLDVLVIGIEQETVNPKLRQRIIEILRPKRINVEVLPTDVACTTFNFLNAESRSVAGALLPPLHIKVTDNDLLNSKIKHRILHQSRID
ncbi:NADH dehydrogenase [ubiquinone] 1 alpha subcomplex assembly factor 3-like [Ctenocephalides felis]|uniref:NADH dehydrogenase [ubiquinone] 1 alpha subcomplex assembly factor 3-like n=1 Tax=Ctenocephalides felis TaxID=7515 RepID=UPI000E6E4BDE|nr:NADH dehydrogenase [ubiquinone] 1 alpha subcomplex assembly factor 3-like [Ctenocephalides felis]